MHDRNIFKLFFLSIMETLITEDLQARYDEEAERFRDQYDDEHPDAKLWIHGYDMKETEWFVKGEVVSVCTRVVRFMVSAGPDQGENFTFMGSMFVSGSKFSKQFILTALSDGEEGAQAKAETSCATLHKWRMALDQTCVGFADLLFVTYKEAFLGSPCRDEKDLIIEVCTAIFLSFKGRFPLWKLH